MNKSGFLLITCVASCLAWRAVASELPVETFFKHYRYSNVQISPDGDFLAALAPVEDRIGLAVIDLKNLKANWAYSNRGLDVQWIKWATNERLLFRVAKDGYLSRGLLAVNRDGAKLSPLVRVSDPYTQFLALLPHSPDEILVASFAFSQSEPGSMYRYSNIERMNIFTGHMNREMTNPGKIVQWVIDHEGAVRAAVALDGTNYQLLCRTSAKAPWEKAAEYKYGEDTLDPIDFEYDNKTLLVRHYGGEPMAGIYTFDTVKRQLKDLAFRHAQAEPFALLHSDSLQAITGVEVESERLEDYWFHPYFKSLQEGIDRALPRTLNRIVSTSHDESKVVILAESDRTPGAYYLLDNKTGKLEKLFEQADWIHAEDMAEMKPIQYTARDGLVIHGYLTLPRGGDGKNLPLIVNPHGGPGARDVWGFNREVQFFANRGYAVLQMNFRGSTGYGLQFRKAGFREWGHKQQDDITDGVKWAIAQGVADPKRICIYGASYGGYATLVGLEKTPEMYRCGICMAGVTDIPRLLKKQELNGNALDMLRAIQETEIGDRKEEKARLSEVSPLGHVDAIRVPVLMAHGELDPIVPVSEGRDMARALKSRGKLYDFIVEYEEGHGFHKEQNVIKFWSKVDQFLKANMN